MWIQGHAKQETCMDHQSPWTWRTADIFLFKPIFHMFQLTKIRECIKLRNGKKWKVIWLKYSGLQLQPWIAELSGTLHLLDSCVVRETNGSCNMCPAILQMVELLNIYYIKHLTPRILCYSELLNSARNFVLPSSKNTFGCT